MSLQNIRSKSITAAQFLRVWNNSPSCREAAARLGLAARTCQNYATKLREAGKFVKVYPRGRPCGLKMETPDD